MNQCRGLGLAAVALTPDADINELAFLGGTLNFIEVA